MVAARLIGTGLPPITNEAPTENEPAEVAVPLVLVTEIVPVLAPTGTTTTIIVGETLDIVAATPLNFTTLLEATELKPLPLIVTEVPTVPLAGKKSVTAIALAPRPLVLAILPPASY